MSFHQNAHNRISSPSITQQQAPSVQKGAELPKNIFPKVNQSTSDINNSMVIQDSKLLGEQTSQLDLQSVVRTASYKKGMRNFSFATPRSKSFSYDMQQLIPTEKQRERLKRKALNATSQGYVTKYQYDRDMEELTE